MKTSGLIFELKPDNSAWIIYEDYDVAAFSGMDVECTYSLDADNFFKLLDVLGITLESKIYGKLIEEFGLTFDGSKFTTLCEEHGIKYDRHVWIS